MRERERGRGGGERGTRRGGMGWGCEGRERPTIATRDASSLETPISASSPIWEIHWVDLDSALSIALVLDRTAGVSRARPALAARSIRARTSPARPRPSNSAALPAAATPCRHPVPGPRPRARSPRDPRASLPTHAGELPAPSRNLPASCLRLAHPTPQVPLPADAQADPLPSHTPSPSPPPPAPSPPASPAASNPRLPPSRARRSPLSSLPPLPPNQPCSSQPPSPRSGPQPPAPTRAPRPAGRGRPSSSRCPARAAAQSGSPTRSSRCAVLLPSLSRSAWPRR